MKHYMLAITFFIASLTLAVIIGDAITSATCLTVRSDSNSLSASQQVALNNH
jgi:hypothetical protein